LVTKGATNRNVPISKTTFFWRKSEGDPGQILEQLKNTPPTNVFTAYEQAQANSNQAWSAEKQQLEQTIPKIPAPTGLPAQKSGSKQSPTTGNSSTANKETALVGGNKEKAIVTGKTANNNVVNVVKEAPPPRPITPTRLASGNTSSTEPGKSDTRVAANAQNALNNVNLDTNQISTKAGTPPKVDLTGAADPGQIDLEQQESAKQVQQAKGQSAKDINKDYGEINPWVLIATGEVKYFEAKNLTRTETGNYKLGEKVTTAAGGAGTVVGVTKDAARTVNDLQTHLPRLQALADAKGIPREQFLDLYEVLGPKAMTKLATKADDEIVAAFKAVELEKLDAGHSVARHGPQVSNPALKKRITQGIAPDGKISPASPSTRFKSYQDWVDTRKAGINAIENHYGVDISKGPGIGGNPPDTSYKIVVEHSSRPNLGEGFYGTGTRHNTSITSSGVTRTGRVFPGTAPVKSGINRTLTTIEWVNPSLPGGDRWKVVQHIPWARDFDFATKTYTAAADYVIP
jgi:hypothetical protein